MERGGAVSLSEHGRKEARECVQGTAGRDSPYGNEKTVSLFVGSALAWPWLLGHCLLGQFALAEHRIGDFDRKLLLRLCAYRLRRCRSRAAWAGLSTCTRLIACEDAGDDLHLLVALWTFVGAVKRSDLCEVQRRRRDFSILQLTVRCHALHSSYHHVS